MRGKTVGNDLDCGGVCKHPRLKSANIVDAKNSIELRSDKVGRNGVDCRNTMRVLRRERSKNSASVETIGVESAKVRLHAALPPESRPAIVRQQGDIAPFMACIRSHGAEEAVGVFVGDPLEFRGGEVEDVGRLGKDVGN